MVRFENVGMRYGMGPEVLRDVSFTMEQGAFYFITGASGAGKSTLLRLMDLGCRPSRGLITLFGRDVATLKRSELPGLRRRIGVVFQDFRLINHLSALDNVGLPLRVAGAKPSQIRDHVAELLSWVGLADQLDAKPATLSGGQKQRVAIARAVMDLGAVAKLKETLTGDTLAEKGLDIVYPPVKLAEPSIAFAIEAKSRSDEDRMGNAVHRILEEDQSLRFYRDPQTREFLLAGMGQQHVEIVVSRMKRRYGVDVALKAPKIPYRETIRGKADVQGRHKKQTGGHGQFGDCWIKMEPLPRGAKFEFANEIFGGSIPKNFIPAVEKGIVEAAENGFLAGYPMVDFKVIVYDGSYHDVDSSELAFKLAARKAFKAAMQEAKPVLLEPIQNVEIQAPVEYAGDLMGDLNSRRGRISGMETKGSSQFIRALVPMAEMLNYQSDLTAMTQGRASFTMEFDHYDYVPQLQAEKIIAAAKAAKAGEEEEEE